MIENFVPKKTEILRRKQVMARTGLARSTIYDHMRRGGFPLPIKIGSKIAGWIESEIECWIQEQVKKTRNHLLNT